MEEEEEEEYIIYTLISKNKEITFEYSDKPGNFQKVSTEIIQKLDIEKETKITYEYDQ
jgi:hypothetical protein